MRSFFIDYQLDTNLQPLVGDLFILKLKQNGVRKTTNTIHFRD